MNKKIPNFIAILIIIGGLGISAVFTLAKQDTKSDKNTTTTSMTTIESTTIASLEPTTEQINEEESTTSTTNNKQQSITEKTTTKVNDKATTSTSKTSKTTKKTTTRVTTTNKPTTPNKTDSNGGPYYYEGNLPECSDNDSGLKAYINKLENGGTYKYFLTYKESKDYGEYAARNLGYGYWYQQKDNPRAVYRGNNCYRELWAVQLYVGAKLCKNSSGELNPVIYLPATPKNKLVGIITYLRSKGYSCEGKSDILTN